MPRAKSGAVLDDPEKSVEEKIEKTSFSADVKKEEIPKDIRIPKTKEELAYEKIKPFIDEEGHKMVRGRFKNYECPGGSADISVQKYHPKYVKPFHMRMFDNEVYEIPLYVARFLNGIDVTAAARKIHTCAFPTHGFKWDKNEDAPKSQVDQEGKIVPIVTVAKWNRRYGFESMAFDVEE